MKIIISEEAHRDIEDIYIHFIVHGARNLKAIFNKYKF